MAGSDPASQCLQALVAHWSQFGTLPGGALHEEGGLRWFETPARNLPYNGVLQTHGADDAAIDRTARRFRERGVQFWWIDHPGAEPTDLGRRLEARGLVPVEEMHFMWRDLDGFEPAPAPEGVEIERDLGDAGIKDYIDLTLLYWEVPGEDAAAVTALHRAITPEYPGRRYLARIDGKPIGKAYLSWPGPDGVCGIYGMSVRSEARGRGVAGALTAAMLADAREQGLERCVLHSTDMAVGVYRRIGFTECARVTVHATAELWSKED